MRHRFGNASARFAGDGYTFELLDDSIIERLLERGIELQTWG